MITDWAVWPIFIAQLITFSLLLLPRQWRFLGIRMSVLIAILLLLVAGMIVLSLSHDSTDVLPLYF